jgi:hypothetical protein
MAVARIALGCGVGLKENQPTKRAGKRLRAQRKAQRADPALCSNDCSEETLPAVCVTRGHFDPRRTVEKLGERALIQASSVPVLTDQSWSSIPLLTGGLLGERVSFPMCHTRLMCDASVQWGVWQTTFALPASPEQSDGPSAGLSRASV